LAERRPDSDQLVGLSRRLLDEIQVKVDRLSDKTEVVLIGTSPQELFEGGKATKDLLRPQLAELKKAVFSYKVDGPIRSRLSPSKDTGWVAANVVLKMGKGKKEQTLPPFRVLWIFAEEGGLWNLVSEHQSLALKQELRGPTPEAALAEFEKLDAIRKERNVKKSAPASRDGGTTAVPDDGGTPAAKEAPATAPSAREAKPSPNRITSPTRGGTVSASQDGGFGTFE
jgi:hypothetical protein